MSLLPTVDIAGVDTYKSTSAEGRMAPDQFNGSMCLTLGAYRHRLTVRLPCLPCVTRSWRRRGGREGGAGHVQVSSSVWHRQNITPLFLGT